MLSTSTQNTKSHTSPASSSDLLIQELIQAIKLQNQVLQEKHTSKTHNKIFKAPNNSTLPACTANTLNHTEFGAKK